MSTALVIGANRGIGLELTRQLAARGDTVWAACRAPSPELQALPNVRVIEGVDVTSEAGLSTLVEALQGPVDMLLVVAGVLHRVSLEELDLGSIRHQLEVNAIGPLRVVAAVQGSLHEGAKVGLLTSRMGSITDNTSGSHYGYRMSKAALNMAGVSLAMDLRPHGVAVALLHPGYVRTDMTGHHGLIDVEESAAGLLKRMEELTLGTSGGFWHQDGNRLPW